MDHLLFIEKVKNFLFFLKPLVKSIIYYLSTASERQSGKGTD